MSGAMRPLRYVYSWHVQGQTFCNFLCHCAVRIMLLVDFSRRFWSLLISGFFKDMYVVLMLLARLARFWYDITYLHFISVT